MKGDVKAFFQVPDSPEAAELVKGTGALLVEGSAQTTNSWGLRGPEPDTDTQWRGIVAGRFLHAGAVRRRRPDADRMPQARPAEAAGRVRRGPEHGPSGLLARTVLLFAR